MVKQWLTKSQPGKSGYRARLEAVFRGVLLEIPFPVRGLKLTEMIFSVTESTKLEIPFPVRGLKLSIFYI